MPLVPFPGSPPFSQAVMSKPRKRPTEPAPCQCSPWEACVEQVHGSAALVFASVLYVASPVPPQELSPDCVLWVTWASQSPTCPHYTVLPPGVALQMTWTGEWHMFLTIWRERPAHYGAAVVTMFLLCLEFSNVASWDLGAHRLGHTAPQQGPIQLTLLVGQSALCSAAPTCGLSKMGERGNVILLSCGQKCLPAMSLGQCPGRVGKACCLFLQISTLNVESQ